MSRSRGGARHLWALREVTVEVGPGETLGVVGESGSGKTTLGLIAVGELRPTAGEVAVDGRPLERGGAQGRLQMVFQDPVSSLDPRMTVEEIVTEPLVAQGWGTPASRRERAVELIEKVGLRADHLSRRRSQFSGGQCQRIAIARAMITHPVCVVLDEPTSSLDVIVQARVLNLLKDLQDEYRTAYLFITHNLAVVEAMAERTVVLYHGRVMEEGPSEAVLASPRHPYTQALAASVLGIDAWRRRAAGEEILPQEGRGAPTGEAGCPYAPRCPLRVEACLSRMPPLVEVEAGRRVACHVVAPSPAEAPPAAIREGTAASLRHPSGGGD